jgi:hypothetical protein
MKASTLGRYDREMPEIAGYGFGRVTIDGREETRDVIVLSGHVARG